MLIMSIIISVALLLFACEIVHLPYHVVLLPLMLNVCRLLGLETSPASVQYYGRTVKVLTSHVGIDPPFVHSLLRSESVTTLRAAMRQRLGTRKVMVGIDNLDYLQGVSLKLLAFECFLQLNHEQVGKVGIVCARLMC